MFSASATCSLISSPPDAMQGRQALQEQSYKATAAVPPPPPPPPPPSEGLLSRCSTHGTDSCVDSLRAATCPALWAQQCLT